MGDEGGFAPAVADPEEAGPGEARSTSCTCGLIRLMIEILHDFIYQNVTGPRNFGNFVDMMSCGI